MKFKVHSFRHAGVILNEDEFVNQLNEVISSLSNIDDSSLIERHNSYGEDGLDRKPKSLSKAINELISEELISNGWTPEPEIFQDDKYRGDTWRLDFAKQDISIEVAFNHASVIAWNLTKPVLASELNHVNKAIQTKVGIIITATKDMKKAGGFDGAIGTFEKFIEYLPPLRSLLTAPILIIGLEKPDTFHIEHHQLSQRKKIGNVVMEDSSKSPS